MSHSGAGLEISGLTKRYGNVNALSGVDLTVAPGEFISFLGPSGSGKTTTLNVIAGFVEPDQGTVKLDNEIITGVPPWKRDMGVVFQNYSLFPHLRVAENVAFPLKQRKVSKREAAEKVAEILEVVGLAHLANRYPSQLSGGQQQRVALARALVFGPKLLLLDEPLGALDKRLREDLQLEIKRIHREVGVTFIFVTHDQEEALVMSDRIAIFNEGRLEQIDTVREIYDRPRTLFTAEFIGESNVIRGRIENHDGNYMVRSGTSQFDVLNASNFDISDNVGIVIRPENLEICSPVNMPEGRLNVNMLTAEVSDVIYLGGRRRVVLQAMGQEFIAEEPSALPEHKPGDQVTLAWSASSCHLVRID